MIHRIIMPSVDNSNYNISTLKPLLALKQRNTLKDKEDKCETSVLKN